MHTLKILLYSDKSKLFDISEAPFTVQSGLPSYLRLRKQLFPLIKRRLERKRKCDFFYFLLLSRSLWQECFKKGFSFVKWKRLPKQWFRHFFQVWKLCLSMVGRGGRGHFPKRNPPLKTLNLKLKFWGQYEIKFFFPDFRLSLRNALKSRINSYDIERYT